MPVFQMSDFVSFHCRLHSYLVTYPFDKKREMTTAMREIASLPHKRCQHCQQITTLYTMYELNVKPFIF